MKRGTVRSRKRSVEWRRVLLACVLAAVTVLLSACAAKKVEEFAGETVERQTESQGAENTAAENAGEENGEAENRGEAETAGDISDGSADTVFPELTEASEKKPLEVLGYDRKFLLRRWVYTYDEQGNVASKETYYEFGEDAGRLEYRSEYTYDEQGILISEKYYRYDSEDSGQTISQIDYTYLYDDQGRVAERQEYQEQKPEGRTKYTYDEWDNVVTKTYYSEDGSIADQIDYTYTYDEQGNVLREKARSWGGGVNSDYQYTYDEQGKMLTEERDIGELLLWNRKEYIYDEQGNLLTVYFYNKDGDCDGRYEYVY